MAALVQAGSVIGKVLRKDALQGPDVDIERRRVKGDGHAGVLQVPLGSVLRRRARGGHHRKLVGAPWLPPLLPVCRKFLRPEREPYQQQRQGRQHGARGTGRW